MKLLSLKKMNLSINRNEAMDVADDDDDDAMWIKSNCSKLI